ncbi:hypothetical protein BP5796_02628 [Coleophoma crateriformis]|uniref:Uncharacterized protein n=1 Tax=Coleophoma crateriformis TaxID=565419 RepID=A0A3D8SYR2_9HELO|nr:hypothetical protein BP5796_02628 [Coleophoma crateriformis]
MRFSTLSALCVAPLALASTLEASLYARGALGGDSNLVERNGKGAKSSNNNNNNAAQPIIIEQTSSSTEIILIWYNQGGNQATTTVTETKTVTAANGAVAAAATHSVVVGGAGGLVYTPDQITAAVGDMVVFEFQSTNHTATQSAFTTPCEKLAGGMDTGFVPNVNNSITPAPQMAMQVTVDTPIWFYCKQSGHCGKGMVFSINPTANKTQQMFQSMAIAQNGTGSTAAIQGGAAKASSTASASTAAATSGSTGMTSGTGTLASNGACSCSCLCGVAAFPNAAIQGVAAFGGMSGEFSASV